MIIREDTTIEELRDAGILPEFIYRDCQEHGMYEAENALCEWDWEWDWDLGRGYDNEQLDILEQVCKIIADGIKAFHANPEEVKRYKEERERIRLREELIRKYKTKFQGNVYQHQISWLVDYEITYGELPLFFLMCCKLVFLKQNLSDRLVARLCMAGINVDQPMTPQEVCELMPGFNLRQVRNIAKKPWPLSGKFKQHIEQIHTQIPDRPLYENDPFWTEINEKQNLDNIPAVQLMRMIAYFRNDYNLIQEGDNLILIRTSTNVE
ncbi:MAG: hypothetical protein NC453_13500 [Muribaculum sp.]|nr:hypothetical protein [Muribaculum sp.]